MYYQNPYNYPHNNKKKDSNTYLGKISRQLMGVLAIMLVLLLLKYVKNDKISLLNERIKDAIYSDYTTQTQEVFKNNSPKLNSLIGNIFGKFIPEKKFVMDFLPVDGKIISNFGSVTNPVTKTTVTNQAIEMDVKTGTEVKSVFDGTVDTVENSKTVGYTLIINHNDGFKTVYGHLSEIKVNEGEPVTKGSVIALSGDTGSTTGPHLYFELLKADKPVNPLDYLKK